MPVSPRRIDGERQIGGHLPERHERYPDHAREHVVTGRLTDPVGPVQREPRTPPDDRVRRIHHVEHPAPGPGARRWNVRLRVVREPHDPALPVHRRHLRAARLAVIGELAEQAVEIGRPREHDPGRAVGHVVLTAERRLGPERSETLPGDEEPRSPVRGQGRPPPVHRVEEGAAGLAGLGLVDQVRHPRRQVGVLERHGRGVAAAEVLERVDERGVDPPAAGGGDHHQVPALEAAGPLQVPDGETRARLRVGGGVEARIGPDGLESRTGGQLLDVADRRAEACEVPPLLAE